MKIAKCKNQQVSSHLQVWEQRYNILLPQDYKKFLLVYNGGKTPETKFHINHISSDIEAFYGFETGFSEFDFVGLENTVRWEQWRQDRMLPIAYNAFQDNIFICLDEAMWGKVYFCYHDRKKKYIELASDFTKFISLCESKEIGHIRTMEERISDMRQLGKSHKITKEKLAGWQAEIDEYANMKQETVIL